VARHIRRRRRNGHRRAQRDKSDEDLDELF
jgi:hypothetical protein